MKNVGNETPIIEDFLKNLINNITNRSVKYYFQMERQDHLFINSETEMRSAVTPAIADLATTYRTEFRCKNKKIKSPVDYCIQYKDIVLVMEFKYAHKAFTAEWGEEDTVWTKFNSALDDLSKIDKNDIFYSKNRPTFKVIFEVIVFDTANKKKHRDVYNNFTQYQEEARDLFYQIPKHKFNSSIDFKYIWLFNKDLAILEGGRKVKAKTYVAVGFIGYVEKLN